MSLAVGKETKIIKTLLRSILRLKPAKLLNLRALAQKDGEDRACALKITLYSVSLDSMGAMSKTSFT